MKGLLRATRPAGFALACILGVGLLGSSASGEQEYSGEGAQACLACHESDKVMGIRDTPHANFEDPRSPASREQCESCHGPSATHMQFPMQVGNIVFTKHGTTPIGKRNETCLACHSDPERQKDQVGKVDCMGCHTGDEAVLVDPNHHQGVSYYQVKKGK